MRTFSPAKRRRAILVVIGVVVSLAALPFIGASSYHLHALTFVWMYVALALGLNVLTGLAGLIDLGYIAFFAVGAYGYALLSRAGWPLVLQFPVVAALATTWGLLLGLPTLRVRGDYLAVVTLGFGELVRMVATNWSWLTNGPEGLANLPAPAFGPISVSTPVGYYFLGLGLVATVAWVTHRVAVGRLGWAWCALRTSEDLASSLGHDPVALKLFAFCIGANVAATCGMFFASFQSFVSPESFVLFESVIILSMVILGGGVRGNLLGVALGALVLSLLPELFRGLEHYRFAAYGAAMMAMVLLRDRGLIPWNWLNLDALAKRSENPKTADFDRVSA